MSTQLQRKHLRLRTVAGVIAVVAVVGAGCSSDNRSADRLEDADGRTQSGDAWNPESVPPLEPVQGGAGPLIPTAVGAVVEPALGTTTSTSPALRWPTPTGPGPYRFTINDLGPDGGRELWTSGSESLPQTTVPPGVMTNGRAYRWSASDAAGGTLGPLIVRVDTQRDGIQPIDDVFGIGVARFSGESVVTWASPTLATVDGDVGLTLSYRPSSASASVGLPAGWRLNTVGSGTWRRLVDHDDGTLTLEDDRGVPVIFEPNPGTDTGYRAVWGERQNWPTGSFSTLIRHDDGSVTVQDTGGTVTTFAAPVDRVAHVASVWNADRPVAEQQYTDGRLTALRDPVSNRAIELHYGGGDGCPGDSTAPDGLLCGATMWDGTELAFGYQPGDTQESARLIRLVSSAGTGPTASVTDLAFDSVGRVAALRSPLATAAVAAGTRSATAEITTRVAYDDAGRVATVTSPAPTPGAPPATRRLSYALNGDRVTTTVEVPGVAAPTSVTTADAATFQTVESIDAAGQLTTVRWDRSNERVEEVSIPGGLVTSYERDDLGVTSRRVGPATVESILSGAAPTMSIGTDRTFRDGTDLDGQPMRGLAVTYWDNLQSTGTPVRSEIGPRPGTEDVPDPFRFSWSTPPIEGRDWSARMTGVIRIPTPGNWTITSGGAPLWIDERPCRPSCELSVAEPRPVRIRLDVTGPTGDVDLEWAGPGASGTVPSDALAPALGRTARQSQADALATGNPLEMIGRVEYSDAAAGVVSATLSRSGLKRGTEVEPYRPDRGEFARIRGQVPPNGPARRTEYHPTTEPVANPCGGSDAVQGGIVSANVDPGGTAGPEVRSSTVFDAAGREVATRTAADAPWTCTRRDAAGRAVSTEQQGATGSQEQTLTIDYAGASSAGASDPTMTVSTSTTADGDVRTESVQSDLLGRTIRSSDLWGTITELAYDPQFPDRLIRSVVTPSGGAPVSTIEHSYGPSGERLASSLNGAPIAVYTYDSAGWLTSTVSGATTTTYRYDGNGRPSSRSIVAPAGTWIEEQELSPTGRTLATALTGPDGNANYGFRYDEDARLVAASLEATIPVSERAWAFTYDPDGNLVRRVAELVDGSTSTVTNVFDEASHLRSTDDPAVAGGQPVTYDSAGRITSLGPLAVSYDAGGQTTQVSNRDGSSVSYQTRFGRTVVRTTVAAGTSPPAVLRFGDAGVVYDGTGRFLGRQLTGAGAGSLFIGSDGTQERTITTIGGNRWFVLDGAGQQVGRTSLYEPYGRRIDLAQPATGVVAPVQPGYQLIDGSRLGQVEVLQMGARIYLPTLGSFLQPDPVIGGGGNPYSYADSDPVNGHDPTGNLTDFLKDIDWGLVGQWAALTVVSVLAAGLAYAGGPAIGTLVSHSITGSVSVAGRLAVIGVTGAIVGWGIGVGATYAAAGIMGWNISFGSAASIAAAFAAIGTIRPIVNAVRAAPGTTAYTIRGLGARAGVGRAWATFKETLHIGTQPQVVVRSPITSGANSARQSIVSESIEQIDEGSIVSRVTSRRVSGASDV
ncbi:MAG: RHS repeat-associated core domain-containing protein [Microthrixaceae bacterium]